MANQQLFDYIKQQVQQGKNREEIKQELFAVGWEEKEIEEAFNMTGFVQLSDLSLSSSSAQKQILTLSALPGVGDLLKRAFLVYKARLGTFLGIMIFPVIFGFFLLIPSVILKNNLVLSIFLLIVFWLAGAIIGFWSQVSLIFAIRDKEEKIGIIESFRRGRHKMISFIWVSILVGFITAGGYILFIIPGIIFIVWFAFSAYVLVSEDLRGMNALLRSKQLVAGYWWKVLWRFFVMGIVIFIPIILLYVIFAVGISTALAELIIRIISTLFVSPFVLVFGFLLYEDLRRQKGQALFEPPQKRTKIKFILIGIAGLLLVPAILASIVLVSFREASKRAQGAVITADMNQFRIAAEMIYWEEGSYNNVSCVHSELIPFCTSVKGKTGKEPIVYSSREAYCIYTELPGRKYYCLGSNKLRATETAIFPGNLGYCDGVTFVCP